MRLIIFFFIAIPLTLHAIPKNVVKIKNQVENPFYVEVFKNKGQNITWRQIIDTEGQSLKSEEINFQHTRGRQWIKFDLKNCQNEIQTAIVHVDIVYLEYFQYFFIKNNALDYQSKIYSWRTPITKKPISDRYFSFPVVILPNELKTILISLEGSGGVLFTPVYVYPSNLFYLEQQKFDIIFYGTVIINLIFICTLFVVLCIFRQRIYAFLFIYWVGYLIYSLNLEGFLANYTPNFFGDIKWLSISSITSSLFSLLFFLKLLQDDLKKNFIYLKKISINNIILIIYFITILLSLFVPYDVYHNKVTLFIYNASSIIIIFLLISAILNKSNNALILTFVILPVQLFKVLINLSISEAIPIFFISNFNLYHLKYIIPVYEFYCLGLASILILFRNLKNTSNELSITQLKFIAATETERRRLAQDLHDELGGTLSAIKGKIASENISQDAIGLVDKAIDDLRYISYNLASPELENDGLIKTQQNTIDKFQTASNIKFTFITFGEIRSLNRDYELNIYRIITELVNNIVKHSKAQNAIIQLIYYKDILQILIEDDGIGIKSDKNNWGIGLKNINSRVNFLRAKLNIDSSPKGTTVMIEIPLKIATNEA